MISKEKIKIAFVGRTNVGKTSLIRTILKSPIGEVADRADVTIVSTGYDANVYTEGMQAVFFDTPGIKHAKSQNLYRRLTIAMPDYVDQSLIKEISEDQQAVVAIRNCDAAVYVADLTNVPSNGHKDEMEMVKDLKSTTIAVLNKRQECLRGGEDEARVESRISQWREACKECRIDEVVVFDSHWDRYSKVNDIYETILSVLPEKDKDAFSHGIREFIERERCIQQDAVRAYCGLIFALKAIKVSTPVGSKGNRPPEIALESQVADLLESFQSKVYHLYQIAAENPGWPIDAVRTTASSKTIVDFRRRVEIAAKHVTVGSAAGAIIGGVLGGVSGLLFPGFLLLGAHTGAQIGGTLGGGLGTLAVLNRSQDRHVTTVGEEALRECGKKALFFIFGNILNGFSRGRSLNRWDVDSIGRGNERIYASSSVPALAVSGEPQKLYDEVLRVLCELEAQW
jgi:GTPase Era involved in 16S rRNA processing